MKTKAPAEIKKQLKGTTNKLREYEERCVKCGVALRPDIKGYMAGAIWALEWALGRHG